VKQLAVIRFDRLKFCRPNAAVAIPGKLFARGKLSAAGCALERRYRKHSLPGASRAQVIRTTSKGEITDGSPRAQYWCGRFATYDIHGALAQHIRASRPRHDVAIGWPCGIHEH
jgi:hypothetical protein